MRGFSLRYALHLGFPTHADPWLKYLAGAADVEAHIACAAALGFAGIGDKDLLLRAPAEQSRIGAALARHGMAPASFVENPTAPLQPWNSAVADDEALLRRQLAEAIAAGKRAGGALLIVTSACDADRPIDDQCATFADHLDRWALDMAEGQGIRLCLEPISPSRLSGVLVTRVADAMRLVDATESRLGLVFDTVHVAAEGDPLIETYAHAREHITLIQLADLPGRVEPGAGTLDLGAFLQAVRDHGYGGLIELEHTHSTPGEAGERLSLQQLAAVDPR